MQAALLLAVVLPMLMAEILPDPVPEVAEANTGSFPAIVDNPDPGMSAMNGRLTGTDGFRG